MTIFHTCRCRGTTKWFRENVGATLEVTLHSGEVIRGSIAAVSLRPKKPHHIQPSHLHQTVDLLLEGPLGSRWVCTDGLRDVTVVQEVG